MPAYKRRPPTLRLHFSSAHTGTGRVLRSLQTELGFSFFFVVAGRRRTGARDRSLCVRHGEVVAGGGSGGVVLRRVGGGGAGAAGCEPAAGQVPGRLRQADGLHGLRDGALGHAVVHVLLRRRRHAQVAARVPLLHHPAGAQRPAGGPVPRPALRPPPRAPLRVQARQRQRHALHQ
jgi:hypothetical protein